MEGKKTKRREFVKVVASGVLAAGALPAIADEKSRDKPSAAQRVRLAKTNVRPTRLGIGTGTASGNVQRAIGQQAFTRLIRHAYDRGIRFIDTAGEYGIHRLIKNAIQGLPREELVILTKVWLSYRLNVPKSLERFRRELGTDYFDIVLLHGVMKPTWPADLKEHCDALSAAKHKGLVRAVGVSVHGMPALKQVAARDWVEVAMLRMNHNGMLMDGPTGRWGEKADHAAALAEIKRIRATGKGVVGMKLFGGGQFTRADDRQKSIQFVFGHKLADAVTIGFKSPAEVDGALERITQSLT